MSLAKRKLFEFIYDCGESGEKRESGKKLMRNAIEQQTSGEE